ncbi:hypothetical protein Lalb_Chr18g0051101 [Lupinus albus]|uniref:Uncharacterized protein n=1 Tax=Lupinus albus TaxID=3870 RepID=A0A6A4NPV9_LUPAL|nr:hypothetical protein Lalb_Chr18g0051101 [Lupinus albus]
MESSTNLNLFLDSNVVFYGSHPWMIIVTSNEGVTSMALGFSPRLRKYGFWMSLLFRVAAGSSLVPLLVDLP